MLCHRSGTNLLCKYKSFLNYEVIWVHLKKKLELQSGDIYIYLYIYYYTALYKKR